MEAGKQTGFINGICILFIIKRLHKIIREVFVLEAFILDRLFMTKIATWF